MKTQRNPINYTERIKMIKAMEFIARQLNDEELFEVWLEEGVADGDVEDGDLAVLEEDRDLLEYYIDEDAFAEIMQLFLRLMKHADRSGGLYCDGIVSGRRCD